MARIRRIHFSGLGHRDARFPALTLDLRDSSGHPVDTVIWAENGTGKSSLLNLFFSTYRPNQRQFLGKQAEGKLRELTDYVGERDLASVLTEWDTTNEQRQGSMLGDESDNASFIVGQVLSWKGFDKSNELKRLFFTLRPNHTIRFDSLPILGLAQPVASIDAFRDWLDEQHRLFPRLEIRHTTNQSEWREHLANNHLDPELFTYQLRMNEGEGGVNNLFNNLKSDRDFIRLFLQLGFDPISANQIRENLQQFLPKLRNRPSLEMQLEFNEKLIIDLDSFLSQLSVCRSSEQAAAGVELQASNLLAALHHAGAAAVEEANRLSTSADSLGAELTRLTSQRALLTRRQNYYRAAKCRLEESEAQDELRKCKTVRDNANTRKRLLGMAGVLQELNKIQSRAKELQTAILREQEESRPVLYALQGVGDKLKAKLLNERSTVDVTIATVETDEQTLRNNLSELYATEIRLSAEQASAEQQISTLRDFFLDRDSECDDLRRGGWIESKESAEDALKRWGEARKLADDTASNARRERDNAIKEKDEVASEKASLNREIATAEAEGGRLQHDVSAAESSEERIATHPQMRAAVESARADLNLPQTAERLSEYAASIFRHILRTNVEVAEGRRTQAYYDKHRLFPPPADVELIAEKLVADGIKTATAAANWLAYNISDPKVAHDLLVRYPSELSGIMLDAELDGGTASNVLPKLSTEQIPVLISAIPTQAINGHRVSIGKTAEESPEPRQLATVLPRHSGAFNFAAAEQEIAKLSTQQIAHNEDLDQLNADFGETRKLADDLHNWLDQYGGAKLRILREKLRAADELVHSFNESLRNADRRHDEIASAINRADATLDEVSERLQVANNAIATLHSFLKRFEVPYETKRSQQHALETHLQSIGAELIPCAEMRQKYEGDVLFLSERKIALAVRRKELETDIREIRYTSDRPLAIIGEDTISALQSAYRIQVAQYEGTYLNTKAQGELSAALERASDIEAQVECDFKGLDRASAESWARQNNLADQMLSAERALSKAHEDFGKADLTLKQARQRLQDLGIFSDQERPSQMGIIPQTSRDAAATLTTLAQEYEAVQLKIEDVKAQGDTLARRRAEADKRAAAFGNYIQRLRDQSVGLAEGVALLDIPPDESRLVLVVDDCIKRLQNARSSRTIETEKLLRCYTRIQNLTQDERYAKVNDLPAKSLFSHMPLDELCGCAAQKRIALDEDIKTLRADLDLMGQHRETLVSSLLNISRQAIRLLRRAERWSTMPDGMIGWEGEPFLRIRLMDPHSEAECATRLKSLVDRLLEDGKIPAGVELVFDAIMVLVGESGVDATILKPETQRRKIRYAVREMGGWSEGERTTVAILLYCTLVKIRSQSRRTDAGQDEVSALLLDNPIGPCSKPEFLQLHRQIAEQLGVQLIYATGINDPAALSIFPNWIRLAKNRIIPETGELAVGIVGQADESIITKIRIFERKAKAQA